MSQEVRWDGVSSLNNFQYSNDQITVWRAYNVGKGKVVKREAQAQGKIVLQRSARISDVGNSFPVFVFMSK